MEKEKRMEQEKIISMSKAAKKRILKAAVEMKGKNLCIEKTEWAVKTLQNVPLPI